MQQKINKYWFIYTLYVYNYSMFAQLTSERQEYNKQSGQQCLD